jgi:hypothetical protein
MTIAASKKVTLAGQGPQGQALTNRGRSISEEPGRYETTAPAPCRPCQAGPTASELTSPLATSIPTTRTRFAT